MDGTDMLHIRRCLNAMRGTNMLQRKHNSSCSAAPRCTLKHDNPAQLLFTRVLLTHACKVSPACIPNHILSTKPSQW